MLHTLAGDLRRYWAAWAGIALYWVFDVASFYAAARFIGLHLQNVGETVLAYATGYALYAPARCRSEAPGRPRRC